MVCAVCAVYAVPDVCECVCGECGGGVWCGVWCMYFCECGGGVFACVQCVRAGRARGVCVCAVKYVV